jgi:L-rhamnose isomerase
LAVLGGNSREVKCQRRALTSGLRLAEEAIIRTAKVHKWTKTALEQALDDLRGLVLPRKEEADEFLKEQEQRQKHHWMDDCQRMAQNAINLVSQASRILTINDWSPHDCKEFLEDMEKEFRKVRKALDTYSPQECDAAAKKRIMECQLLMETAHYEAEKVAIKLLKDHEAQGVKKEREADSS